VTFATGSNASSQFQNLVVTGVAATIPSCWPAMPGPTGTSA
jgi:hypothetical protein